MGRISSMRGAWWSLAMALGATVLGGCASESAAYQGQRAFASPEAAVVELDAAAAAHDMDRLEAIFGREGRAVLSSGDPVADRHNREVFAIAIDQGWTLEPIDSRTRELVVGHEAWPFPVPLVRDSRGWWFDTEAGRWEVLARRIGRNELATIGTLRTYAIAQREYAGRGHDGRPAGVYARKIRSDPGRRNGLYWPVSGPHDDPSPLGEFAAEAEREGYTNTGNDGARPFRGYFYRILERQGPAAPGGAMSYIENGEMTRGFAMIAHPADYMNSGVMTFIVGPDGVVYEADLGDQTATVAQSVTAFDPDGRWTIVEP